MDPGLKLGDRYELGRELGRGGMGVVYLAHDHTLDRDVAIKVVRLQRMSGAVQERFVREAKIVAKMDHPSIVPIYDLQRDGQALFYVMPVIEGITLRQLLDGGRLSSEATAEVGIQIAEALHYSHLRGVVHRDIKPENAMVASDDDDVLRIKVMDFGIALSTADARITGTGNIVGTPEYLSPEQVRGGAVDARTDIYMLGAVLFECLVGRGPFDGSPQSMMYRILEEHPAAPHTLVEGVDETLSTLVARCLAKDAALRPQHAGEIAQALRSPHDRPVTADRVVLFMRSTAPPEAALRATRPQQPLVGREPELRTLRACIEAIRGGSCHFVLVSGAAGLGKTRLLEELDAIAAVQRIGVLHGRFVEREHETFPYQGFCDLVHEYLRTSDRPAFAEREVSLVDVAADLLRLFPMLAPVQALQDLVPSSAATTITGEVRKADIFELLARTMVAIGAGQPMVLVIEDLHNADVSVEALQYLFRRLGATPTLLVATTRLGHDPHHPLVRLTRTLRSDPRFVQLEIEALSPHEHQELLRDLLRAGAHPTMPDVDAAVAQRLYEVTEGNPYFANQLVRALRDRGELTHDHERWALGCDRQALGAALRDSVSDLLDARLAQLPTAHADVLRATTVLGRSFDASDLELLLDNPDEEDTIDALIDAGFLRERDDERIEHVSGPLCELLYAQLSRRRRRELHQRYAAALLARHGQDLGPVFHRLAHHYTRARAVREALQYASDAAVRSLGACCPEDAIHALEAATRLVDSAVSADVPGCGRAFRVLAEARRATGDDALALEAARRALEERHDDPSERLRALMLAAALGWRSGHFETAINEVDEAVSLAGLIGNVEQAIAANRLGVQVSRAANDSRRLADFVARLHAAGVRDERRPSSRPPPPTGDEPVNAVLGDLLLVRGEYLAAKEAFQAARSVRRSTDGLSRGDECRYLLKLVNLAHKLGRYDEAIAECEQGLVLIGEDEPALRAELCAAAGLACTSAGRFAEAAEWIEQGVALVGDERTRHPRSNRVRALLARTRGNMLVGRGKPNEAIAAYRESLEVIGMEDRWEHSIALFNVGEACCLAGRYDQALDYLEQAFAAKAAIGDRWGLSYTYAMRARIHLDLGASDAAESAARAGFALAEEIRDPKLSSIHRTLLGRIHMARGDTAAAARELNVALCDASACDAMPEVIAAQIQLAALQLGNDALDSAAEAAQEAQELAATAGSRMERAAALLALGRVEARLGHADEALRRIEAADRLLANTGNRFRSLDVALARAELATTCGRSADAAALLQLVFDEAVEIGAAAIAQHVQTLLDRMS